MNLHAISDGHVFKTLAPSGVMKPGPGLHCGFAHVQFDPAPMSATVTHLALVEGEVEVWRVPFTEPLSLKAGQSLTVSIPRAH